MATQTVPSSGVDLFADDSLMDPYEHYRALRDAGPAVYLEQLDAWAVTRYADVRAALKDWKSFSSTSGIAFNPIQNSNIRGNIITTEGEEHDRLRAILNDRLRIGAVRALTSGLQQRADDMVSALVDRGSFDAVEDLARQFPSQVVGDLVGLSTEASQKLFRWGDASFTVVGPLNDRTNAAMPVIAELLAFMAGLTVNDFAEQSIGRMLYETADRGQFGPAWAIQMLWNFTGAGADTTISSLGNMIWLLGQNPEAWAALRNDPTLIPSACNEVLRYESSIQIWGRTASRDLDVDGTVIPEGARIAVGLASANRDERHYTDADTFDITRNPRDLVTFGYGVHMCVGAALARAQMESVLEALVRRVDTFEIGEPIRHLNNVVRGLESLPVTIHAA